MRAVSPIMVVVSSVVHSILSASAQISQNCHGDLEDNCGVNATCHQSQKGATFGTCVCLPGFQREGDACIAVSLPLASPSTAEPIMGGIMTFLLWTLSVVALIIVALAILIRRYALLDKLYALRVRRYDTVFVSTAANVDDDAPIT